MKIILFLFFGISLFSFIWDGSKPRKIKNNTHRHSLSDSSSRNPSENNSIKTDIPTIIDRDSTYIQVEQKAFFPGGELVMQKYIARFLVQPKPKRSVDIKVKFVVERYGAVTKVHVSEGEQFVEESNEAIRVVHSMMAWEPAKIKGTAVASYNELMVHFGKK